MQFTVVNKHQQASPLPGRVRVYIGRPSVLGNPFQIGRDGDRDQVIRRFKVYLDGRIKANDPVIMRELRRVVDLSRKHLVELACFCKPAACHGDHIREALITLSQDPFEIPEKMTDEV